MASNTENLGLLKKNPSTDGADTFNIQTMLNDNWDKLDDNAGTVAQTLANILKPTTPPQIGLPSTTTPDGMFQALGNTGELHVWRKTVVTAEDVPAGYKLETVSNLVIATRATNYAYGCINLSASTAISVDDNGKISLTSPTSVSNIDIKKTSSATTLNDNCRGKFCLFTSNETYPVDTIAEGVYYIPSTATFTVGVSGSNNVVTVDTAQKVVSWAKTPASTTTTYPVSINPNAYQEGDNAKAAGYVVGDVVSGKYNLGGTGGSSGVPYTVADSVNVSDDGTVTLNNGTGLGVGHGFAIDSLEDAKTNLLGKFVISTSNTLNGNTANASSLTKLPYNVVVYIPSDAVITALDSQSGYPYLYIDRYQPVTGYAAIPAGTTIEYLGKLGDKTRIQAMNYVGTGTYGSSNAISLTFDFEPKFIAIQRNVSNYDGKTFAIRGMKYLNRLNADGNNNYAFLTWEGKKVSWYSYKDGATNQMNISGETYIVVAIG